MALKAYVGPLPKQKSGYSPDQAGVGNRLPNKASVTSVDDGFVEGANTTSTTRTYITRKGDRTGQGSAT